MKKHLKNAIEEMDEFFVQTPSANQKAWGIINEFYHLILTHMEKQNIKKADLAKKLGKSRSAISQMFNKTPNITVRKMVEIADSIGLDIDVVPSHVKKKIGKKMEKVYVLINTSNAYFAKEIFDKPSLRIKGDECYKSISCNDSFFPKNNELPI